MATQVQNRRGTTAEHSTFTGAVGELTVDTTKDTVVVHDGAVAGGRPLLREDQSNLPTSAPTTGIYNASGSLAISTGGSGRLFINSSGNAGVGTSTPNVTGFGGATVLTVSNTASSVNTGVVEIQGGSSGNGLLSFLSGAQRQAMLTNTPDGQLQFWTGGASISEKLRITSAGLVGVGTSSPSELLTVAGNARFDKASSDLFIKLGGTTRGGNTYSNYIDLDNNGYGAPGAFQTASKGDKIILWGGNSTDAEARIGFSIDDSVWIKAMGTTVPNAFAVHGAAANSGSPNRLFTITKTGLVGIGTTTPAAKLHVNVGTNQNYTVTSTNSMVQLQAINDAANAFTPIDIAGSYIKLSPSSSEAARIDTSGRLLVGTSSAYTEPYLTGAGYGSTFVVARNAFDGVAQFSNWASASVDPSQIFISRCRSGTIGTHTGGALGINEGIGALVFNGSDGGAFRTGAVIQATIDGAVSSGDLPTRLVFSTTADGASSPTERMRIFNSGRIDMLSANFVGTKICSTLAASVDNYLILGESTRSSIAANDGTTRFIVYTNGNVQNSNNSYAGISDIKLKENVIDASSQWEDLKALQVRKYNFKEETGQQTHTQIGLIAQEVELVSPGLVTESPDRDAEGNDLGTVTKSVNYSVLYMKAVKALQEAMERIETLEAKVAALEGA